MKAVGRDFVPLLEDKPYYTTVSRANVLWSRRAVSLSVKLPAPPANPLPSMPIT